MQNNINLFLQLVKIIDKFTYSHVLSLVYWIFNININKLLDATNSESKFNSKFIEVLFDFDKLWKHKNAILLYWGKEISSNISRILQNFGCLNWAKKYRRNDKLMLKSVLHIDKKLFTSVQISNNTNCNLFMYGILVKNWPKRKPKIDPIKKVKIGNHWILIYYNNKSDAILTLDKIKN